MAPPRVTPETTAAEDAELLNDAERFLRLMHTTFPEFGIGFNLRATDDGFSVVITGPDDRADGRTLRDAINRALVMACDRERERTRVQSEPCPNCGRVRMLKLGVCDKCYWDLRTGAYATTDRQYEADTGRPPDPEPPPLLGSTR